MSKVLVDIYKCSRVDELYLYVLRSDGLSKVPSELLERFGRVSQALPMILTPEKKLARANAERVLAALAQQGYYLQLPESSDDYMRAINVHNSKLGQRP